MRGRIFLSGRRMYLLEALLPRPIAPDHLLASNRFLESFSLVGR
jgi:hypothetical protein